MTDFRVVPAAALDTSPLVDLIDGFIPEMGVGILYGPPGTYKSFCGLSMAAAIADGTSFCGMSVRQGHVCICLGEGLADAGIRLKGHRLDAKRRGVEVNDDAISYGVTPFTLTDPDELNYAIRRLGQMENLAIVVIDTMSQFTNGVENPSAARKIMAAARRIAEELQIVVLLIHHTDNTGKKMRGSDVLKAFSDFIIRMTPTSLIPERSKTGATPEPVDYVMTKEFWVDEPTGQLMSTLVFTSAPTLDELKEQIERGGTAFDALDGLDANDTALVAQAKALAGNRKRTGLRY